MKRFLALLVAVAMVLLAVLVRGLLDGNGTDGTGTDGNDTDGNGTDGNGTDGSGLGSSTGDAPQSSMGRASRSKSCGVSGGRGWSSIVRSSSRLCGTIFVANR